MRTKVLLGLAVLAAGAATSMAQSNVYSLNIVGYANVSAVGGYSFQSSPFRVTTAVSNGWNEIGPSNTGQFDGDAILKWTGSGWATYSMDSTFPTGFSNDGITATPAPIVNAGVGYLYYNGQGATENITYVGEVRSGTNVVTIPASPEYAAVGSPGPLAGGVITVLQLKNTASALTGDNILQAKVPLNGYITSGYDDSFVTGFSNDGINPLPEPIMAVGQGFFFDNLNAAAVTWTQVVP